MFLFLVSSRHTSPMLFAYWCSLFFCSLPSLKVDIEDLGEQGGFEQGLKVFAIVTFWPAVLTQVIIEKLFSARNKHCTVVVILVHNKLSCAFPLPR